tara:strand:- start:6404 stop:7903 length:1500 start_codon:yes stop_codon:yes gene_type:complete
MKLNMLDRAVMSVSPQRGLRRVRAKALAEVILGTSAGYDAAGKGRRGQWIRGSGTSQTTETRRAITILRGRHRELVRNNGYVSAAINETVSLTIGDGLQPVARGGTDEQRKLAQELMLEWAKSTFIDVDGLLDLFGLQALMMRTETEGGEGLALKRIRKIPGIRVPLQIRVLEGDYLDHTRDGTIDGRRVVMGVAFGPELDRVGYYIHRHHPGDNEVVLGGSRFTPVSEVAHVYEIRRPGQVRGMPRATSVMMRVDNLDKFQDARLEQQKIAACLAALITQGEDGKVKGDVLPERLEPAMLARLGPDESVTSLNPPSVSGQQEFVTGEEHIIAKGYGLNHQVLTGNISGANFSSSKIGRLDVYGNVGRWRRQMIIPQFCKRVEAWFIEAAYLAGYDLTGITFDWVPPRSEILNLRDDIPALIKQARGGFGSMFSLLRSLGHPDPREVLQEIAECNQLLDDLGIVLDSDPRRTTAGGQLQPEEVEPPPPNDPDSGALDEA